MNCDIDVPFRGRDILLITVAEAEYLLCLSISPHRDIEHDQHPGQMGYLSNHAKERPLRLADSRWWQT